MVFIPFASFDKTRHEECEKFGFVLDLDMLSRSIACSSRPLSRLFCLHPEFSSGSLINAHQLGPEAMFGGKLNFANYSASEKDCGLPDISYVVPSIGRDSLERLVQSIRSQQDIECEVIVVFDGVRPTISTTDNRFLKVIPNEDALGPSRRRNEGATMAKSRFISFVDDDDWVSPRHGIDSLNALENNNGANVVVSGLAGLSWEEPKRDYERIPPTFSPRGKHWNLSTDLSWESSLTKQSAVISKDAFFRIGGFSETLRRRQLTEFFWRLNGDSGIIGLDEIHYFHTLYSRKRKHLHLGGPVFERWKAFQELVSHSHQLLQNHPQGLERLIKEHERKLRSEGNWTLGAAARIRNSKLLNVATGSCKHCESKSGQA